MIAMKPSCCANMEGQRTLAGRPQRAAVRASQAFTLVELLLSMTILSVLMLVVVNVIGIVQQQWTRSNSRVTAFREARMAFDVLARNLSQATLNTYWTAELDPLGFDQAGDELFKANKYIRKSELQFVCGQTAGLLTGAAGQVAQYPGHGVFFQAPLGVTRLGPTVGTQTANTENMVNLLCGRGYFVAWGDDQGFRPPFLAGVRTVQPRFRYRLMEYSPTAESNQIYFDPLAANDLPNRRPIEERSRMWFQDAIGNNADAVANENAAARAFTRPVADNIIALVISPQNEQTNGNGGVPPESIAPIYEYDSTLTVNPSANTNGSPQGTQHLLPPLLKITMISLDSAAGERLAEAGNQGEQQQLSAALAPLFHQAQGYNNPSSTYYQDLTTIQNFLVGRHLNYRVFTTTIVMKQARWSR
jgi:uncharacterized protein (TIGR02599 family)